MREFWRYLLHGAPAAELLLLLLIVVLAVLAVIEGAAMIIDPLPTPTPFTIVPANP